MKKIVMLVTCLSFVACSTTETVDLEQMQKDIRVACKAWIVVKDLATIAGLAIPGLSSGVIVIADFVDPVCNGTAAAALNDAATAEWILNNINKIKDLIKKYRGEKEY